MCVYLLAVHHVSEAGQCMYPDVNVFMLHGPHGELQRCGQVTAAGCQLQGIRHCIFNVTDDVTITASFIYFIAIALLSRLTFL